MGDRNNAASALALALALTLATALLLIAKHSVPKESFVGTSRGAAGDSSAAGGSAAGGSAAPPTLPYSVLPLDDVLTPAECDALIRAAEPHLKRSMVVNRDPTGDHDREVLDAVRTSSQAWLTEDHPSAPAGKAVAKLLATAAGLTGVRRRDLYESCMVAKYGPGQQYEAHHDSCTIGCEKAPIYRLATLLVYLNQGYRGGTTTFPKINYTTAPKRGSGVLFYNTDSATGAVIPESLHSGDPVLAGQKYIATVWIKFNPSTT